LAMKPDTPKEKKPNELFVALSFISHIGITMAVCVFVGVMLGRFLDGLLGTAPLLLIICSLLGAAASFKALYDIASKSPNNKR